MRQKSHHQRINDHTYQKLVALEKKTKMSKPAILERAVENLEKQLMMKEYAEYYDNLANEEMSEHLKEIQDLDGTIGDGLD